MSEKDLLRQIFFSYTKTTGMKFQKEEDDMKQKKKEHSIMEKNEMNYGYTVELFPLLYTDAILFIPKYFAWEAEAAEAIVTIYETEIRCNLGSKLLIKTDEGIREMSISFSGNGKRHYRCNLLRLLREKRIRYEKGPGIYCDGTPFLQKSSTGEALYCKDAIIEHTVSPHWGHQFELYIVNKQMRPMAGGKSVKIIRFNWCDPKMQTCIEKWMCKVLWKKRTIAAYDLEEAVRQFVNGTAYVCALFYQKYADHYDWEYYRPCGR